MTFLPIVQRELHVAARRVATYRLRVLVAAGAGAAAVLPMLFSPLSPSTAGNVLFAVLAWAAFGFCQFEGLRVASDALAEEKREGTLGLLFLTDLRGYDVVLGKFASAAVRSFSALLASLPIFALPLLMGGVTGGEFWRVMLALLAALLVALTAGLCVSASTANGLAAMGGTALALGLLFIVTLGLSDWLGGTGAFVGGPLIAFRLAFESRYGFEPSSYWLALLGSALLAVTLLIAAGMLLMRNWRETAVVRSDSFLVWLMRPQSGSSATWGGQSAENNPAVWLAERMLPGKRVLWAVIALGAMVCFVGGWMGGTSGTAVMVGAMIAAGFLIKLWMALIAPQAINDSRRSGALEILLTTPLSSERLMRGYVDALIGYFFGPALVSLLAFCVAGALGGMVGGDQNAIAMAANMIGFWFGWLFFFALDMFALAYTGMWLGLTENRPGIAAAKTVIYVLVVPWVTMIVPVIGCIGLVVWPVFWIVSSSRKLDRRFRAEITRQFTAETERTSWWPF